MYREWKDDELCCFGDVEIMEENKIVLFLGCTENGGNRIVLVLGSTEIGRK
jgi:hypothetical protein